MELALDTIVLIGAAFGSLLLMGRTFYKLSKTWFKFIDEWNGSDSKPGIPARLDFIESELKPNHGSSVKDKVNKLEAQVETILEYITKR